jgi:hypothetical protein
MYCHPERELWICPSREILSAAKDDRWRAGRSQRRSLQRLNAGPSWLQRTLIGLAPALESTTGEEGSKWTEAPRQRLRAAGVSHQATSA